MSIATNDFPTKTFFFHESRITARPPRNGLQSQITEAPSRKSEPRPQTRRGKDILISSIGGNDIALRPSLSTIVNIATAMIGATVFRAKEPIGLGHFVDLFGKATAKYLSQIVPDDPSQKPRAVIICMLYFLDENSNAPSWAGATLATLKYNSEP